MFKNIFVNIAPVTAIFLSPIVISVLAHNANANQEQAQSAEQIRMVQDADNLTACTCPFCAANAYKNAYK